MKVYYISEEKRLDRFGRGGITDVGNLLVNEGLVYEGETGRIEVSKISSVEPVHIPYSARRGVIASLGTYALVVFFAALIFLFGDGLEIPDGLWIFIGALLLVPFVGVPLGIAYSRRRKPLVQVTGQDPSGSEIVLNFGIGWPTTQDDLLRHLAEAK